MKDWQKVIQIYPKMEHLNPFDRVRIFPSYHHLIVEKTNWFIPFAGGGKFRRLGKGKITKHIYIRRRK